MAQNERRLQPNDLNQEMYFSHPKVWMRAIFTASFLFSLGLITNISLERKINNYLSTTLSALPNCTIHFEKLKLEYFSPKISIRNFEIEGNCFGQPNNKFNISDIDFGMALPSLYPLGPRFRLNLKEHKTEIKINFITSLFSHYLEIAPSQLNTEIFAPLTANNKSPLKGIIKINGFFKFNYHELIDSSLIMNSENLIFPAQNIANFDFGAIPLHHFLLKSQFLQKNKLSIEKLELGKKILPVEFKSKGELTLNMSSFGFSLLDLNGVLKLSKEFRDLYPFLNFILPTTNSSTNTFQVSLNGPITHLNPPKFK